MAAQKKAKATKYVVLRGDEANGPFTVLGNWTTNGQSAAKKAAALAEKEAGRDPEEGFFIAVPASSFYPQKPIMQLVITFAAVEEEEEAEDAEVSDEAELEEIPGLGAEAEEEEIDPALEEEAEFDDAIEDAPVA